ncbi:uncharacterized protein THITE_2106534 [Thermothielavioides terrestris NRRL 8126]|uniref:Small ribosomal subunit protein bS18m n=1 Tax=Thermothielavioides terrestris (strain ATCC 38088 / NRRL 8126) TaxID=578455 RepID=G2QQJ9_THETT|nr:uncharacterized protein THITE_2106534 [Thermothielavioides terrestris NRRL 8126]AEO62409.1 hypothetical protein THITE_2106534 [Thermothielavioides terrestris NRRL 8126]
MACRQWLSTAARQCQSGMAQQKHLRTFSTSAPVADIRSLFPNSQAVKRSNNNNRANASNPSAALQSMLAEGMERGGPLSAAEQQQVLAQQLQPKEYVRELRFAAVTDNYMRQMPRRWKTGDVYAPRDLSPTEMDKWRQARPPETDVVDMFGFNPLDNYKNFALISEFMTTMGRIKHSSDTGLRPVNQRKMAKAIRRAIGMGLHPSVHFHPEILRMSRLSLPVASIPTKSHPSQNRL